MQQEPANAAADDDDQATYHRVALVSDIVDYPEGAAEFIGEIVEFSKICDADACHHVIDLVDGIMRHAKDRYRTDLVFTPRFAEVMYELMNYLFPKAQKNSDYLDSFVEFLTNWKSDRIFDKGQFDIDYLLNQLEKYYPIGSMPSSSCNNTSLYSQLKERSYGGSYFGMAANGDLEAWTGYEYGFQNKDNNNLMMNPNNQQQYFQQQQYYPPQPNCFSPPHLSTSFAVSSSSSSIVSFPPPALPPVQKALWLRNVILVDGNPDDSSPKQDGYVTLCSSTIRVNGLPDSCTEEDLSKKFKNHGIVYSITMLRERTNRSALVCMKKRKDAKKAYDSFNRTLVLRKFYGPNVTIEWKAGPGLTALRNYEDFWNKDIGVAYLPQHFISTEAALETIGESFTVDLSSLPPSSSTI